MNRCGADKKRTWESFVFLVLVDIPAWDPCSGPEQAAFALYGFMTDKS